MTENNKLIQEFLQRGGEIQKLPAQPIKEKRVIRSTATKTQGLSPILVTEPDYTDIDETMPIEQQVAELFHTKNPLAEAKSMYGERQERIKLENDDDITKELERIVRKNPDFIKKHSIPEKYLNRLPKELHEASKESINKKLASIDKDIIAKQLAELKAMGFNFGDNNKDSKGSDSGND